MEGECYPIFYEIILETRNDSTYASKFSYKRTSHKRALKKHWTKVLLSESQKEAATLYIEKAKAKAIEFPILETITTMPGLTVYTVNIGDQNILFYQLERMSGLNLDYLDSLYFSDIRNERKIAQQQLEDSLYSIFGDVWMLEGIKKKLVVGDTIFITNDFEHQVGSYWWLGKGGEFLTNKQSKLKLIHSRKYSINAEYYPPVLKIFPGFEVGRKGMSMLGNFGLTFGIVAQTKTRIALVIWQVD